jgi:hypothetical protein
MKCLFSALVIFALAFVGCSKKDTVAESLNENMIPTGTIIKTGTFSTNAKTTSGTIKVIQGANNAKSLVFENFSSGNGPDVRVWLSPNTSASTYVEIGALKATSGNFSYELPASVDLTTNNKVLIWCKDVRLLFGHASLQ